MNIQNLQQKNGASQIVNLKVTIHIKVQEILNKFIRIKSLGLF